MKLQSREESSIAPNRHVAWRDLRQNGAGTSVSDDDALFRGTKERHIAAGSVRTAASVCGRRGVTLNGNLLIIVETGERRFVFFMRIHMRFLFPPVIIVPPLPASGGCPPAGAWGS